jgi:hypothetical protein
MICPTSDHRNGSSRNRLHASTRCKFSHAEPNCIDSDGQPIHAFASSQIYFFFTNRVFSKKHFCPSVAPAPTN